MLYSHLRVSKLSAHQVCLPGLHISLGVYDRLWALLEGACTGLDLLLAEHTQEGGVGSTYSRFVAALRKRDQLKSSRETEEQRATTMEQLAAFFSLHIPTEVHRQQLELLRKEATKVRQHLSDLVCNSNVIHNTHFNCNF